MPKNTKEEEENLKFLLSFYVCIFNLYYKLRSITTCYGATSME